MTLALVSIVRDAVVADRLAMFGDDADRIDARLRADLDRLADLADLDVPSTVVLAFLAAWSQLFGVVSFELTNQTRGIVEHHAELFDTAARLGAERIGLR